MAWRSLLLLALVVGTTASANTDGQNSCQACRSIVSFVRTFNSSAHRQEYTDLFKNYCEQYYPPSTDFQQGPCSIFVTGLFYLLDNIDPVTHCDNIGACDPVQPSDDIYQYMQASNAGSDLAVAKPKLENEVICSYCLDTLEQVKEFLSNKDRVDRLKTKAVEFCEYLKVIDQDKQCIDQFNRYIDWAVPFIASLDSRKYCAAVNMCAVRPPKTSPTLSQLPTLADFNNFGIETAVIIGPKPSGVDSNKHNNGPECALCKTVVKEMFRFLRENKTEANIINTLDRVCGMIYPAQSDKLDQCQAMVKAYTRELVQLLVDETDPQMICVLLEQCAYSKTSQELEVKPAAPLPTERPKFNDLSHLISALDSGIELNSVRSCFECKMFIKYLRDQLNNSQSQEELKQWLLVNLCKELPEKDLIDSCSAMVETYSATFFQAIVGELNPQSACVQLGVCNPKNRVQIFNLGNQKSNSMVPNQNPSSGMRRTVMAKSRRCQRCTSVVALLDDYLASHRLSGVTSWETICDSSVDSAIRGDCMGILTEHGSDIIQMVPNMESPRHLCQQIAEC